ncbi:MAG: cysteine--tRNA ligase [Actinomycetia bacterium]|nr:cysteine--tRNA ligase [Actinomycetes bacterium]
MKLYNTLSRSKQEFEPLVAGQVSFYVCGPTVYNDIHIGNARTFISFDVIRRYLEYRGYTVRFVQNITDVDDKIIQRASEEGRTAAAVAAHYTRAFQQVMQEIGIQPPTVQPRATEEILAMQQLIQQLVANQHAYVVDGDVYFAVRSYPQYGALSGRDINQLRSGARVQIDERKHDALDFALWKAAKPVEPAWDSPWGPGRPGWHIECSAMSARYLGETFDIHGGGEDLVFPHHENEIAQSRAGTSGQFARYWLHGGMLTINQEKMSKSEGNYLLLKDVLQQVRPAALRLLMLQSHYRSTFDYAPERLTEATAMLQRVENALRNLDWTTQGATGAGTDPAAEHADRYDGVAWSERLADTRRQFEEQMDDDFNTAGALAAIFELINAANSVLAANASPSQTAGWAIAAAATIRELLRVLGVDLQPFDSSANALPAELTTLAGRWTNYQGSDTAAAAAALIAERQAAREARDWPRADQIRSDLSTLGLVIEDTADGARIFRSGE